MKKFLALVFTVLLMAGSVMTAFAAEDKQRVYDKAGLFSEAEKEGLEKELKETVDDINMDFVILTTSDKEGASLQDYADDFYDQGGFGTDEDGSGLVMLIDMEDRTVYLSTKGTAIRYLTDQRILDLTDYNDEMYDHLADGEYAMAAEDMIEGVEDYVEQGIPDDQYNYIVETGETDYYEPQNSLTWFEIVLAIAVPAVVAYLYIRSIMRQYAMVAEKKNANQYRLAYRATSKYAFAVNTDELLHHTVTTRIIPKSSDSDHYGGGSAGQSTIHTSSSGSFHGGGGGGRSF